MRVGMTSNATATLAWAANAGPAWLHLLVMAFAVLVLYVSLAGHR
ncbi:hypothetical protein EES41_04830 [Streptomyces sp. ADI95-16]|nr:hypothetical protein EES41_04830 [Streptomyces sp. ADI95-16]